MADPLASKVEALLPAVRGGGSQGTLPLATPSLEDIQSLKIRLGSGRMVSRQKAG